MVGARVKIDGIDQVMANLNKEIAGIENRSMGGLLEGGLTVQGTSQRRVPVEYGNVRGSAYTRKAQDGSLAVDVGYTAAHAVFLHENMEQKLKGKPRPSGLGVYWGPNGQPKFLESAARDESSRVVASVRKHAEVKPK
jgi:hypothetical protein